MRQPNAMNRPMMDSAVPTTMGRQVSAVKDVVVETPRRTEAMPA